MGRRAYVLDGITGAILKQCRLPKPCSHMAYSPPRLGPPKLVAIFCDGSLWSLEGFDPTEAARGGGIGDGATRFRRLHAPTVKDKRLALRRNARGTMAFCASPNGPGAEPLCIFAVVGEKELRFATIRRPGGGNDGASSGGSANISPAVSPTSPLSNASDRTSDRTSAAHEPPVKLRGEPKKTPIAFVCSHPDLSPRICAGYVDGTVRVYDLATCAVAAAFRIPPPIGAKRGTAAPTCAVCVRLPPARHHHGGGGHHGWEGGGHGAGGGTVGEAAVAIGDATGRITLWPMRPGSVYGGTGGTGVTGGGTGGGFGTDGGFGSDDFDDGSYPADGSSSDPRGDAKGRKTAAEMVDEAQASPPDMNRRGACPVIALQTLPANGGIVALVGSFGSAAADDDDAAECSTQAWRVEDDGGSSFYIRLARGGDGSYPRVPSLPPSATRACIATHPSQLKFSAVAVGTVHIPGEERSRGEPAKNARGKRGSPPAPSPPFTVFISEGAGLVPAGVTADDAFTCELAAVRGVDVEATTSATPPARHREAFALGGDAVWAVDLSEGPGGKMKTRVPKAGDPDVASNDDGGVGGGGGGGGGRIDRYARRLEHSPASSAFLIASGPAGASCDRIGAWKEGVPSPCVHAGRDATFVGNADACFSVLSVDGRTLSLFAVDSPKARMAAYALDGECDRVFRGPSPNAVAFSALDWPDTNRRERVRSGASAKARSDGPRGCFGVLHNVDGRGRRMEGYLTLEPRERVVRALFQRVPELRDVDPDGTPAGAVAVLTSRSRLLLAEYRGGGEKGEPCVMTKLSETPPDVSVGSCAWFGPALVYTESNGAMGMLTWHAPIDGGTHRAGCVLPLCGGGVGAAADAHRGGTLLTFTEDAAVCLHPTGDPPPAPPACTSRPIAFMDALCVAWGSVCDSRKSRSLPVPLDGARRAVATAAGRFDAARVSAR